MYCPADPQTSTWTGYRTSILPYISRAALKEELNNSFHRLHPWAKASALSLANIRAIKRKVEKVALKCDCEMSTIAYAWAYFERVVMTLSSKKKDVTKARLKRIGRASTDCRRCVPPPSCQVQRAPDATLDQGVSCGRSEEA
jgi:hypothetical protein